MPKFKFQIAITTLKFGRVEILHQSEGLNSVVKLQVTNVSTEECPYIPWDEFQVFYCIIYVKYFLFIIFLIPFKFFLLQNCCMLSLLRLNMYNTILLL